MDAVIELQAVVGNHGTLQRCRVTLNGSTVIEFSLIERLDETNVFDGSVTIIDAVQSATLRYFVEVRQVATQDTAGFDGAVLPDALTVPNQPYGYWYNGNWYEFTPVNAGGLPEPGVYAGNDDFIATYGTPKTVELTNRNRNQDSIDADRLTLAMNSANQQIDDALNQRYALPISGYSTSAALMLRMLACQLALGWLYNTKVGEFFNEQGTPIMPAKQVMIEAKGKLALIATGTIRIDGVGPRTASVQRLRSRHRNEEWRPFHTRL